MDKVLESRKEKIAQTAQISCLNKSIDIVESAVLGLGQELQKVKAGSSEIEERIIKFGETRINPLIDEMMNAKKANESILREFNNTHIHLENPSRASTRRQVNQSQLNQSVFNPSVFNQSDWMTAESKMSVESPQMH